MLEKQIAYYCGPSLAGIKPSNIASLNKQKYGDIHKEIEKLNRQLNVRNIYINILCECEKRVLVMVYRKDVLEKHLNNVKIRRFLSDYGYPENCSADDHIRLLKKRLSFEEFPHEIGVFLGYPLNDIKAFINHPNSGCLLVGEWKVYDDAENAKKLFCRYNNCRCGIIKRLKKGQSLERIFCAG